MVTPFSVVRMSVAWVHSLEMKRPTPVLGITWGRRPRAHSCRAPGFVLRTRLGTAAGPGPRHASEKADKLRGTRRG